MSYKDLFDRVVVISLRRRPDREKLFWSRFEDVKKTWPFRNPEIFMATDGSKSPPGRWFKQGRGAWGCYQSHLRILDECLSADLNSVLIFEDDVVFCPNFAVRCKAYLDAVPDDWDHLYLGGQGIGNRPPELVNPEVCRIYNVNRTHAHGMRGSYMRDVYVHLNDVESWINKPRHHVDHRFGNFHERGDAKVYIPVKDLCAAGGTKSDISNKIPRILFRDRTVQMAPKASQAKKQGQKTATLFYFFQNLPWPTASLRTHFANKGWNFDVVRAIEGWVSLGSLRNQIHDSDLVILWNGSEIASDWIRKVCDNMDTPYVVAELGLLPQSGNWHMDPEGINGYSSLCGSLDWVTEEDLANFRKFRDEHVNKNNFAWQGGGGYVLVPFQLEHDSSIVLHSKFPSMKEVIDEVRANHTGDFKIMAAPHPKNRRVNIKSKGADVLAPPSGKSTMELMVKAEKVVGVNSTILLETAVCGAPTIALGECPMKEHGDNIERLGAASLVRQIPRGETNLDPWFERMGYEI